MPGAVPHLQTSPVRGGGQEAAGGAVSQLRCQVRFISQQDSMINKHLNLVSPPDMNCLNSSFYGFLLTKLPVSEGFTDKCPNFRRETVLKHLLIILSMKNVSTYFIVFSKVCRSQTSHRRLRPSNFSRFTSAPLIQPVFSLVESHITPTGR